MAGVWKRRRGKFCGRVWICVRPPPEQPLGNAKTGREMWHSIRESFKEIGYVEPDEIQISPREKGRELPTFE